VIPDPLNQDMIYVTTFGGSVWHGPAAGDPTAAEDIVRRRWPTASEPGITIRKRPAARPSVAAAFALLKLLLHLTTNGRYGFFRDELCYIAYGQHLDWGYPDGAPLIGVYAWLVHNALGDSLQALRLLPALAGASMVFLTGLWRSRWAAAPPQSPWPASAPSPRRST